MAQIKNNDITRGASGKFGKQIIFKQKGEKTLLTRAPQSSAADPTLNQKTVREQFVKAAKYAKRAIADPILKAIYKAAAKGEQSAFNVAFKDFLGLPQIPEVDTSAYNGTTGSIIKIQATDDCLVKAVGVRIEHPDGSLVEGGDAIQQSGSDEWIYSATTDNLNRAGQKVTVTAMDHAGNSTVKETVLS